jgi:uncharacterized membrane protein required for colicin V production
MGSWFNYYVLPAAAGVMFLILNLPEVDQFLTPYIPDPYSRILAKAILLIVVVFLLSLLLLPNPDDME